MLSANSDIVLESSDLIPVLREIDKLDDQIKELAERAITRLGSQDTHQGLPDAFRNIKVEPPQGPPRGAHMCLWIAAGRRPHAAHCLSLWSRLFAQEEPDQNPSMRLKCVGGTRHSLPARSDYR